MKIFNKSHIQAFQFSIWRNFSNKKKPQSIFVSQEFVPLKGFFLFAENKFHGIFEFQGEIIVLSGKDRKFLCWLRISGENLVKFGASLELQYIVKGKIDKEILSKSFQKWSRSFEYSWVNYFSLDCRKNFSY